MEKKVSFLVNVAYYGIICAIVILFFKYGMKYVLPFVLAFIYLPILYVIVFSFNEAESLSEFTKFSFIWYKELFHDETALAALRNSLILALLSSALATVIGTLGALGIDRLRLRFVKSSMRALTNIPMMNPDIVTGVSMMLLFVAVFIGMFGGKLGFATMLIAHTTFNIPYVVLSVLPKFKQLDRSQCEAAMDLGCTPVRTFFRIEVPAVMPGILSGFMLGFTLSLDDFVISHFVSSPDFVTLPLYIYNQTIHEVKHGMYALFTLIIVVILALLLIINLRPDKTKKKKHRKVRAGS